MLPNFLIIGAQKSGTTFLHSVLSKVPYIFMSPRKEVNFFFLDELYRRGPDFYEHFFRNSPATAKWIGEASPGYISRKDCPKRIASLIPDVRLVAILRNPIDRAYSQYYDNRRKLVEPREFDSLVDLCLEKDGNIGPGYFKRGIYFEQIERYLEHFSLSQLYFLIFEEMIKDPEQAIGKLLEDLLGIKYSISSIVHTAEKNEFSGRDNMLYNYLYNRPRLWDKTPNKVKSLSRKWGKRLVLHKEPISDYAKENLTHFYRPYNKLLAELTGIDPIAWDADA